MLTLILIGGLLTLLVKGAVDSGGMSTVIEKGGLISESFFTFASHLQKWYFVTKIVLTYCEKKLFQQ